MKFFRIFLISICSSTLVFLIVINYFWIFANEYPVFNEWIKLVTGFTGSFNENTYFGVSGLYIALSDLSDTLYEKGINLLVDFSNLNPVTTRIDSMIRLINGLIEGNLQFSFDLIVDIARVLSLGVYYILQLGKIIFDILLILWDLLQWVFKLITGAFNGTPHNNPFTLNFIGSYLNPLYTFLFGGIRG